MRAIPDLLAAGADRVIPMAVGAGVALATGVSAIWLFVRLLRTQSFHYFAFYTWAAGLFVLAWYG